jgi:myo-inositol-1(or 4)-monophosphatase
MAIDDFIRNMAIDAGSIQREAFHKVKTWRTKTGRGDIVTEVDLACEKLILDRIRSEYPSDPILSEEAGAIGVEEDRPVWVIDPLDGTRNYMAGIPFFCVSIGLVRQGVAEVGAVYDPIHDEMFFARRGGGAFLNGEPIAVSEEHSLEDAIISVAWVRSKVDRHRFMRYIEQLSKETSYFRRFGSAALVSCYVACGRIHAYLQGGLNPWDMAAATLIIEEAGGRITDFSGCPIDLRNKHLDVVAANAKMQSLLMEEVTRGHG